MDYRKTIKMFDEDGETVICDFDIVLNRSMAVSVLKDYPVLVDVIFNGIQIEDGDSEDADSRSKMIKLVEQGKADKLFAVSDNMIPMLSNLFPKMLDAGEIRCGNRDEIIDFATEGMEYDDNFSEGMINFFMDALIQKGKVQPKRKMKISMK